MKLHTHLWGWFSARYIRTLRNGSGCRHLQAKMCKYIFTSSSRSITQNLGENLIFYLRPSRWSSILYVWHQSLICLLLGCIKLEIFGIARKREQIRVYSEDFQERRFHIFFWNTKGRIFSAKWSCVGQSLRRMTLLGCLVAYLNSDYQVFCERIQNDSMGEIFLGHIRQPRKDVRIPGSAARSNKGKAGSLRKQIHNVFGDHRKIAKIFRYAIFLPDSAIYMGGQKNWNCLSS